jgi:hypothetical protein
MSQVLYDSEFALLTYVKENKFIELSWKKHSPELEYRSIFSKAVEVAANHKIEFFLSDIRKGGAVTLANFKWLKDTVIPKAKEFGVLKIGIILNEDLFSKIYADSIRLILVKNKIAINFFNTREDALSWFNIQQGK